MPYYEVITEPGSHSVAYYESEEEAAQALKAHHERAKNGERGGPGGHSAERIKKALEYEEHPADYMASQTLPVEEVKKGVAEAMDTVALGDLISVPELAAEIRDLTRPIVDRNATSPHESLYKVDEAGELSPKNWGEK